VYPNQDQDLEAPGAAEIASLQRRARSLAARGPALFSPGTRGDREPASLPKSPGCREELEAGKVEYLGVEVVSGSGYYTVKCNPLHLSDLGASSLASARQFLNSENGDTGALTQSEDCCKSERIRPSQPVVGALGSR
jgi:hypothetical protein